MFPTINVGPFAFPTAAMLYLIGAYVSLSVLERAAKRLQLDANRLYGLGTTLLLAGAVGARLTFVVIYWPAYRQDLLSIIWPLNSGYNLWGGLVIALAAGYFYGRYFQMDPWSALDALIPAILSGLMFVSLADWLAGPGFGKLTSMPWGISQFGVRRHPVQLYELVVAALASLVWWRLVGRKLFPGQLFLLTTAVYSGGRLLVDAWRENAWLAGNGIHLLQVVCLVLMLVCLYLLGQLAERRVGAQVD